MVRAIDAQQVILQSSVMEKIQQVQQQNPDMQQKYFALQLSEQNRLLKEEVNESDETEKASIKEKQDREKKRGGKDGHDKEKPALFTAEEGESTDDGGYINVKV
jgi:hypothetical protein